MEISKKMALISFNSKQAKNYNIQLLAYIGDAIYEFLTRKHYLDSNVIQHLIHQKTINIVSACAQAIAYDKILFLLNNDELIFIKKAKNFKNKNVPRHLKISVYAKSTAIEALFGFLYFNNEISRINFIHQNIIQICDSN